MCYYDKEFIRVETFFEEAKDGYRPMLYFSVKVIGHKGYERKSFTEDFMTDEIPSMLDYVKKLSIQGFDLPKGTLNRIPEYIEKYSQQGGENAMNSADLANIRMLINDAYLPTMKRTRTVKIGDYYQIAEKEQLLHDAAESMMRKCYDLMGYAVSFDDNPLKEQLVNDMYRDLLSAARKSCENNNLSNAEYFHWQKF